MGFISEFILFILIVLHSYMFFRLLYILHKKRLLEDKDTFFVTSTPWEYKKHYGNSKKNTEGS